MIKNASYKNAMVIRFMSARNKDIGNLRHLIVNTTGLLMSEKRLFFKELNLQEAP